MIFAQWVVFLSLGVVCYFPNCATRNIAENSAEDDSFFWWTPEGGGQRRKLRHHHHHYHHHNHHQQQQHFKHKFFTHSTPEGTASTKISPTQMKRILNRKEITTFEFSNLNYTDYTDSEEESWNYGRKSHSKRHSHDYDDSPDVTTTEPLPYFTSVEKNVTQVVGRTAKLVCSVENLGDYKLAWFQLETKTILTLHTFVVSRNYRINLSHTDYKIYILRIDNLQLEDRGPYMCQVNTLPMITQVIYLDVLVPPDIIEEQTSTDTMIRENKALTLKCNATGIPPPTYIWRREDYKPVRAGHWQSTKSAKVIEVDEKISPTPTPTDVIYEGPVLEIKKISRLHMGAYLCIASNGVLPAVSRRIVVQVNFEPMIWIPHQLVGAAMGENVTIECHSEAFPESINYWAREKSEGDVLTQSDKYDVVLKVQSYKIDMYLTIKNFTPDDLGLYKCFAKNSIAETEGSIKIFQIHPIHPYPEPSSAKIHGPPANRDMDASSKSEAVMLDSKSWNSSSSANGDTTHASSSPLSPACTVLILPFVMLLVVQMMLT